MDKGSIQVDTLLRSQNGSDKRGFVVGCSFSHLYKVYIKLSNNGIKDWLSFEDYNQCVMPWSLPIDRFKWDTITESKWLRQEGLSGRLLSLFFFSLSFSFSLFLSLSPSLSLFLSLSLSHFVSLSKILTFTPLTAYLWTFSSLLNYIITSSVFLYLLRKQNV